MQIGHLFQYFASTSRRVVSTKRIDLKTTSYLTVKNQASIPSTTALSKRSTTIPFVDLNRSANLTDARKTFYDVPVPITRQISLTNSTPHQELPKPMKQIQNRQDRLIRVLKDMLNNQPGESTQN